MKLSERIDYLRYICDSLQETNSRTEKQQIVASIDQSVQDDFEYILEIIDGRRPLGYTFIAQYIGEMSEEDKQQELTFREYIEPLWFPMKTGNFSNASCNAAMRLVKYFNDFIEPIVNRTLRLGIGKSLLNKTDTSPMLAKAFDPDKIVLDENGYYISEKLDGNRCIAMFVNDEWHFISRNGKTMKVNFDMSGLPTWYIYDGEVTSPAQTERSKAFEQAILSPYVYNNCIDNEECTDEFQITSGLINSKAADKDLIYNIFDITNTGLAYHMRRDILNHLDVQSKNVRVLKTLQLCFGKMSIGDTAYKILNFITSHGGEGIMINLGSGEYVQTRSNVLLKYKKVQTMDMKVVDVEYGEGKYEGMIGALICEGTTPDGNAIACRVGSGLSDEQRFKWAQHNDSIIGKIVEVAYFSISKTGSLGNMRYSLRFPRLKKIRHDKTKTSPF